jgi:hypothetical protein
VKLRRGPAKKPLILFYNRPDWFDLELGECVAACEVSTDQEWLPKADAVIFHVPGLEYPFTIDKPKRQVWAAYSQESDVNHPLLRIPRFMEHFDYTMTYRLDSDFPFPYFGPQMPARLLQPPIPKDAAALAAYFASSTANQSRRTQYVWWLMQHMPVDSYGKQLQNRFLPRDEGRSTKLETIAHYKFTLAFENSISHDYVTEKFFDALIVGSVPVYLGAPNVDDLAPADHCYINARDFPRAQELARYLRWLDENPDEYEGYLAWKQRGLRPGFLEMAERLRVSQLCKLCMALHSRSKP